MAATTKYSANVTNLRATPRVLPDVSVLGGRVRVACGTMELATTDIDTIDDIIVLDRLPSNAVPLSITLWMDEMGDAGTADCGVYDTAGVVKDANAFSTETVMNAADVSGDGIDVIVTTAANIVNMGKKLWEWGGDSTDPGGLLDICLTFVAAMTTPVAGSLSYRITYSID